MCNYPLLYKMNFAITMFDYLFDYLLFYIKNEVCKNPLSMGFSRLFRAGDERIELPPKVLETPIIPFDQSPIQLSLNSSDLLSIPYGVRNVKKKIKKISH